MRSNTTTGRSARPARSTVRIPLIAFRMLGDFGAENMARNLLGFWGQGATLVSLPAAGRPAVLAFTIRGELIQGPFSPARPASLSAGISRPYWCRHN